jgi:hypothetical protein
MRVSIGARKINTQGGAIFDHEGWREDIERDVLPGADHPQAPLAPIEVRDFVYRRLINISPVTLYHGALIAGEKGLLSRGLSERHFGDYGSLPATSRERDIIARRILREANEHFRTADSLRGVPGFWEDGSGGHLWKPKDYLLPSLVIPARDERGRIQACQMRLPTVTKKGKRYLWLSSPGLPQGTGSGSPLHFRFRLSDLPRRALITIVEGVLKSDVFFALRPKHYVIGAPSVTSNHGALIELTHGRPVLICVDNDSYTNKAVCFHLAGLLARRVRRERTLATTFIASWDSRVKGIDDAALRGLHVKAISLLSWLNRLSPQFREIAIARFSELDAFAPEAHDTSRPRPL